ncbi:MAG: hypothetical protein WC479_03980 [Candidatus Izemoplasmatales bacterium]|nr:hypothetical protein [Candidatus Izemoplasmatales bacterium]MDD3865291.1 hypothetical protein [Candidatus Izemoplasmatales bacterium]
MYNLIKDSLLTPKYLLKYRNKSGLFVFFYLLVMALFVSIGGIVQYVGYQANAVITTETTGCSFTSGTLSCDGSNYDPDAKYAMFGYSIYFLESGADLITADPNRIIFQGSMITIYLENSMLYHFSIANLGGTITDFDSFFVVMANTIRAFGIIATIIGNIITLILVSLLATIAFWRIKKFVSYKKIFKLVVFAITPFALLLTFYNLLNFDEIILMLLMFFSYRSVFVLNREMTKETFIHLNEMAIQELKRQNEETDSTKESEPKVTIEQPQDDDKSHE